MIEHIEATVVLFKIRQVCLKSAPTKQIMATPLPELMEQLIANAPHMQALEWLVNKFWEDSSREKPIDGTPLVDPDGKLWTREAFGDELSDSEYRLAERLYALAEWGSQLLYQQDYDLSLIIDDYQPQYEDTEFQSTNKRLRQWVDETPLRRLAAVTTQMVYDVELSRWMDSNQAIQDYLAEAPHGATPDWMDVDECDAYTKKVWKALEVVDKHCAEARQQGLTDEEQCVADMVWGWVPHEFEADLVNASREICKVAKDLLPPQTELRNQVLERAYINKVMPEVQRICTDCSVYFDTSDSYSLSRGYMLWWLKEKYWEGRRTDR